MATGNVFPSDNDVCDAFFPPLSFWECEKGGGNLTFKKKMCLIGTREISERKLLGMSEYVITKTTGGWTLKQDK